VPTTSGPRERAARRGAVVAAVAVGGALGTLVRYELALAEPVASGRFPWTTFGVNVAGALLLGLVLGVLSDPSRATVARPFLAVGVCGGLTTFSTWMVESVLLTRDGHGASATVYVATSVVAGLVAVTVGVLGVRAAIGSRAPIVFDPAEDD
jgi:CrcB protein